MANYVYAEDGLVRRRKERKKKNKIKRLEKREGRLEAKEKKLGDKKIKRHSKIVAKTEKVNKRRAKKGKSELSVSDMYKRRYKRNEAIRKLVGVGMGVAYSGPLSTMVTNPAKKAVAHGLGQWAGSIYGEGAKSGHFYADKSKSNTGYRLRGHGVGDANVMTRKDPVEVPVGGQWKNGKWTVPVKGTPEWKGTATRRYPTKDNKTGTLDLDESVANQNVWGMDHKYLVTKNKRAKIKKKLKHLR